MSARPRAAIVIEMERTQRAVNAFAALLAVAKDADDPAHPGDCFLCWGRQRDHTPSTCSLAALDAAIPGWREWTP